MMAKNPCGKIREKHNPYEVWQSVDGGWTWHVLKKYQAPELEKNNPHARWFCWVVTPMTGKMGDMGDVYVRDVTGSAVLIEKDGMKVDW